MQLCEPCSKRKEPVRRHSKKKKKNHGLAVMSHHSKAAIPPKQNGQKRPSQQLKRVRAVVLQDTPDGSGLCATEAPPMMHFMSSVVICLSRCVDRSERRKSTHVALSEPLYCVTTHLKRREVEMIDVQWANVGTSPYDALISLSGWNFKLNHLKSSISCSDC